MGNHGFNGARASPFIFPPMDKTASVKAFIRDAGAAIVSVQFVKADGTLRTVNGLFKPSSKIVGSDRGMAQGEAMKARGQVPVWEIASKQWKSFYADRVVSIK
jgi:hypothetical protein